MKKFHLELYQPDILIFGLIDINPDNNINKTSLNTPLIISELSIIFANYLINAILITFNLC